jgi:hypothetical protein
MSPDRPSRFETVELRRRASDGRFEPVEPKDPRSVDLADLWHRAVHRGVRLGAEDPRSVAIRTRRGAVLYARRGDRLLATCVPPETSVNVARYELDRLVGR